MEFHEEQEMRNVDTPRRSTAADRTADDTQPLTDKARADIAQAADKARSDIAQAAETAKAEARRIASKQKEAGADRLGEVAGAVHGAARSLETGMPQMASYVHDAAVRLEDAAKSLRQRNVDDLMNEIGRFARSQPALFFGGAMLAGFALTRFLRSSASNGSMSGRSMSGDATSGSTRSAGSGMEWRRPEAGAQR